MRYADDPVEYERQLRAKLSPARIRATLAFSGLYQLTHELMKQTVLQDVKAFFGYVAMGQNTWWTGEEGRANYKRSVLDRARSPFTASLLWLEAMGAITSDQVTRLDDIAAHRHDLAHELQKYLVDIDHEPDIELFTDALAILKSIHRFWIEVERDTGAFEGHGDVDLDHVTPLSLVFLQTCIDAYLEGLPEPDA
jgi:hypothetical protein